ncbi:hypothetical protein ACWGRK_07930 [Saccharomonospora azurea]|uniref:Uncharacterized protein n=1 Tax=Saccharomonospora azurea NA-128 TaxID=882081 RepID=H8G3C4_9PSEU|nr:hypothetical protein [Saccharomonospora azurea]EHK83189.1 hypothetical protein SZMC14600_19509 [Saccharomonospora azurea SZMC 14600]EHY87002.1 hypothetical protein SacazDRAFT_00014 [Saccharomonospora azurea NA-128]
MQARAHRHQPRSREEYERGLPDYHDPTAGFGGAAPAYSALTLRIVLASLAVVLSVGGAILFAYNDAWWGTIVLGLIAFGSLIDLGWVIHRKRRGEPG